MKVSKRKVFPTKEVFHLWANQAQPEARNSAYNVFFEDSILYSYGTHFEAANIYNTDTGPLYLVSSRKYSVTTAKHLSNAKSAIPKNNTYIEVPNVVIRTSNCHGENIAFLESSLMGLVSQFYCANSLWGEHIHGKNAPLSTWRIEHYISSTKKIAENINKYCLFFKLQKSLIKESDLIELLTEMRLHAKTMQAIEIERYKKKNTPEMIAKRELELKTKNDSENRQRAIKAIFQVKKFKRFETNSASLTALRVSESGEEVTTSRGANVPLVDALRFLDVIERGLCKSLKGKKIGHYTFDACNNGLVIIGCHEIKLKEAMNVLGPLLKVYRELKYDATLNLSPNLIAKKLFENGFNFSSNAIVSFSNKI